MNFHQEHLKSIILQNKKMYTQQKQTTKYRQKTNDSINKTLKITIYKSTPNSAIHPQLQRSWGILALLR